MTSILISPSFGAGWSTWVREEFVVFYLTYQPIIDRLNEGGTMDDQLVAQFKSDAAERFGSAHYFGTQGADGLIVASVPDGAEFRVNEYDGSETLELRSDDTGWLSIPVEVV